MARRRLPRYKRTGIVIAGVGLATGLAAVILWPYIRKLFQQPSVALGPGKIRRPGGAWIPERETFDQAFIDTLPIDPRFDFRG